MSKHEIISRPGFVKKRKNHVVGPVRQSSLWRRVATESEPNKLITHRWFSNSLYVISLRSLHRFET